MLLIVFNKIDYIENSNKFHDFTGCETSNTTMLLAGSLCEEGGKGREGGSDDRKVH